MVQRYDGKCGLARFLTSMLELGIVLQIVICLLLLISSKNPNGKLSSAVTFECT